MAYGLKWADELADPGASAGDCIVEVRISGGLFIAVDGSSCEVLPPADTAAIDGLLVAEGTPGWYAQDGLCAG